MIIPDSQEVITSCSRCGKKNRLLERAGNCIYRCGNCGANIKNPFLYLVFDCETTGLPSKNHIPHIVQLAWGVYESTGTAIEEQCYIIKAEGFTIPESSTKIHGISNEVSQTYGFLLSDVLKLFLNSTKRHYVRLVAHNLDFDFKILKTELERKKINPLVLSKPKFCTMKSTVNVCKLPKRGGRGYKWPTLQELHSHLFGSYYSAAHNAMSDVRATSRCFFELIKRKLIKFR